jgi:hypothetical protein
MWRVFLVWGWNLIGLFGLAVEGLVVFLWLALVGLVTLPFLLTKYFSIQRRVSRTFGGQ